MVAPLIGNLVFYIRAFQLFYKDAEAEEILKLKNMLTTCWCWGFILHTVFSEDDLLLNCKIRPTSSDGYPECAYTKAASDTCLSFNLDWFA